MENGYSWHGAYAPPCLMVIGFDSTSTSAICYCHFHIFRRRTANRKWTVLPKKDRRWKV